jgi:colicin import membrane protein
MATDDDTTQTAQAPAAPPAQAREAQEDAIRGAFLVRNAQLAGIAGGGAGAEAGGANLRSAYLTRLTATRNEAVQGGDSGVGILGSIYASRLTVVARPSRSAPRKKASAKKAAAPKRKAAAPKRKAAAAGKAKRKAAAPRQAKAKARRGKKARR